MGLLEDFLAWAGFAALVGGAWWHGRSIGLRIGAGRYQDTLEEREERRIAAQSAVPARGVRLSSVRVGRAAASDNESQRHV